MTAIYATTPWAYPMEPPKREKGRPLSAKEIAQRERCLGCERSQYYCDHHCPLNTRYTGTPKQPKPPKQPKFDEAEFTRLCNKGLLPKQIAYRMGVSVSTVNKRYWEMCG